MRTEVPPDVLAALLQQVGEPCSDCGLPLLRVCYTAELAREDHPGVCCDCFEEGWWGDQPEFKRERPRP